MSAKQTDLLTQVKTHIDTYIVDNAVSPPPPVRIAFDPFRHMSSEVFRIFVVPDVFEMNLGDSLKRTRVIALHKTIYVTVSFSKKFTGVDTDNIDIAQWSEISALMDLRENIAVWLCQQQYVGAELRDAELNVIDEPETSNRQFLSFLTMGFQTSASY